MNDNKFFMYPGQTLEDATELEQTSMRFPISQPDSGIEADCEE